MRKRDEYMRGRPGAKYGIYNTAAKCFQFDICEDTPMLAEARLFQKIGDDARKWRFEPRRLPPDDKQVQKVLLKYTPEEAGLLCELLQFASEELMSLSTKNRRSKEPLLTDEEEAHLAAAVKFCTKQVLALFQYTQEEGET